MRLDIDAMMRSGIIRPGGHLAGEMLLQFYDVDLVVKFESRCDPWDAWIRLRYEIADYETGAPLEIDNKVRLTTTRPSFGGLRWWFVCPRTNRRARMLYLPLGGHHFMSRAAYKLSYTSERESRYDRALRRARKLRLRLGGDPADGECPPKPKRMRLSTYGRILSEPERAADVAARDPRRRR